MERFDRTKLNDVEATELIRLMTAAGSILDNYYRLIYIETDDISRVNNNHKKDAIRAAIATEIEMENDLYARLLENPTKIKKFLTAIASQTKSRYATHEIATLAARGNNNDLVRYRVNSKLLSLLHKSESEVLNSTSIPVPYITDESVKKRFNLSHILEVESAIHDDAIKDMIKLAEEKIKEYEKKDISLAKHLVRFKYYLMYTDAAAELEAVNNDMSLTDSDTISRDLAYSYGITNGYYYTIADNFANELIDPAITALKDFSDTAGRIPREQVNNNESFKILLKTGLSIASDETIKRVKQATQDEKTLNMALNQSVAGIDIISTIIDEREEQRSDSKKLSLTK